MESDVGIRIQASCHRVTREFSLSTPSCWRCVGSFQNNGRINLMLLGRPIHQFRLSLVSTPFISSEGILRPPCVTLGLVRSSPGSLRNEPRPPLTFFYLQILFTTLCGLVCAA